MNCSWPKIEVDMVMTGHLFNGLLDPDHPATLSNPTITGILRNTLGYQGVVVSDDMQMKAISDAYGLERVLFLAVDAGVDILLFANNLEYDPEIARKAHGLPQGDGAGRPDIPGTHPTFLRAHHDLEAAAQIAMMPHGSTQS